jgi:hypothetical protein
MLLFCNDIFWREGDKNARGYERDKGYEDMGEE